MPKLFLCSSFNDVANLLPEFIENLSGKHITFIPTASLPETVKFYVADGKRALEKMGVIVDELEISRATPNEIKEKLTHNDGIYITGGNTFFLLQTLKQTGADKLIIEHIQQGKLYIGESAGAIVLSPNISYILDMDDPSKAPELNSYHGLNSIDFYPLPHYGEMPFAQIVDNIICNYKDKLTLYPINNTQAIMIDGKRLKIS
ncbi:peptidase E [Avibacterium paragallinarum]|uniref:peptidase E n=1 Tax=Avibacterium paragallinarum TaxID=728 RepID=UPI002ED8E31F